MAEDKRKIKAPDPEKKVIPSPGRKNIPSPALSTLDFEGMHVAFCFRDIDAKQGDTLQEWENKNLLPKLVHKIAHISTLTVREAKQDSAIKSYHNFPPRSQYRHPEHVSQDAEWASIHVQGKECLGGHIERNIFHVVFLDSKHQFWLSSFRGKRTETKSQQRHKHQGKQ